MAPDLFTDRLDPVKEKHLGKNILSAVKEVHLIFPGQHLEIKKWNELYVAVPLRIKINLPMRGPVEGIDIREIEPIILVFNIQRFPYEAPDVYSNRLDFPKNQLPHLNPRGKNSPANFCLYRGKMNDWFIEHSLGELIEKTKSWLEDAASGNLMRENDRFEVTRIDEKFGYNVFEYSEFVKIVQTNWENKKGGGFTFLRYRVLNSYFDPVINQNKFAISFELSVFEELLDVEKKYVRDMNELLLSCEKNHLSQLLISENRFKSFGILCWPPSDTKICTFFAEFPDSFDEFLKAMDNLKIDIVDPLKNFISNNLVVRKEIPLTIAIPRPNILINFDSDIEFITFLIVLPDSETKDFEKIKSNIQIKILGHINPLTINRANEISGNLIKQDTQDLLFLGCGAIGSKMVLHLIKNGFSNISIIDNDDLYPHNMIRHGLLHESLGWNKAEAMKHTINGIFYADQRNLKIESINDNGINYLNKVGSVRLRKHTSLIDATASPSMLQFLQNFKFPETIQLFRCEIANNGKLGIMFKEGSGRNPRFDDFYAFIYDMAVDNSEISHWLQKNRMEKETNVGSRLREINIGLSCSSETMQISDEIVSLHSAAFVTGFKNNQHNNEKKSGVLQLNFYNNQSDSPFYCKSKRIDPAIVISCRNNSEWEIRLRSGIDYELKKLLREKNPNETGGILIGFANSNNKTIYITRVLRAPVDSESHPFIFKRGIMDIPENISDIQKATGSMIGYIGEWHTHPNGHPSMSNTDLATAKGLKRNLDKVPMPTLIIIVTEKGLYPYIYPIK